MEPLGEGSQLPPDYFEMKAGHRFASLVRQQYPELSAAPHYVWIEVGNNVLDIASETAIVVGDLDSRTRQEVTPLEAGRQWQFRISAKDPGIKIQIGNVIVGLEFTEFTGDEEGIAVAANPIERGQATAGPR